MAYKIFYGTGDMFEGEFGDTMNWIIYYGDKSTFTSVDGGPQEAPGTDVQIIVQRNRDPAERNYLVWEHDYYRWDHENEIWLGVDLFGLWDYLFNSVGAKIVKAGRSIDSDVYDDIVSLAKSNELIFLG